MLRDCTVVLNSIFLFFLATIALEKLGALLENFKSIINPAKSATGLAAYRSRIIQSEHYFCNSVEYELVQFCYLQDFFRQCAASNCRCKGRQFMHHCIWKKLNFSLLSDFKNAIAQAEIGVEQVEVHILRLKLDKLQTLLMQRVHCRQGRQAASSVYFQRMWVHSDFAPV